MKRTFTTLTIALSLLIVFGANVSAQDDDLVRAAAGSIYVVSAEAGGVNYVEGEVTRTLMDGKTANLAVGDSIEVGEIVKAGSNGRAEILMNPGSFIRIDHGAEFDFASTSLDNLTVNFRRGTGIFEVYASDEFMVTLLAGESKFYLIETGVYRVDVDANGLARLEVWNGKAKAGSLNAKKIKKGRVAVPKGNSVAISKFNKSMDGFETWSKDRAKTIAKANEAFLGRPLGTSVLSSFRNNDWNCYDSIGLWVYSRVARTYSFLPFGDRWRSPYGFSLRNTPICYYPRYYWVPEEEWPSRQPSGGSGTPTGTPPAVPQENIQRAERNATPPFRRMQDSGSVPTSRGGGGAPFDTSGNSPSTGYPSGSSGSSSTKSQPAPAAPAPSRPSPSSPPLSTPAKTRIDE